MRTTLTLNLARTCFASRLLIFVATDAFAQDGKPSTPASSEQPKAAAKVDEKALAVIRLAVESLGGPSYLNVKTIVSRGYFTQFREGMQGIPITFLDYMVFPDRERTEFSGGGVKSVQVNVGESGWMADLKSKKLLDVTPQQAEDFRLTLRTSLDNVLRGWWRTQGASLTYVGRREAGLARRNETVRLTYNDGFEVEFEFDAKEGTPSKVKYKKLNAEGEMVEEEDRYAQFIAVGAARAPFIIDHYRAGVQSSRVNYDDVKFNQTVPDSLFTKPVDVKKVKF